MAFEALGRECAQKTISSLKSTDGAATNVVHHPRPAPLASIALNTSDTPPLGSVDSVRATRRASRRPRCAACIRCLNDHFL